MTGRRYPADRTVGIGKRSGWEWWCQQGEVEPPTLPAASLEDHRALPRAERAAADAERAMWHSRFMYAHHHQTDMIAEAVLDAVETNRYGMDAPVGVAVSGPPAVGKTALVARVAREHFKRELDDLPVGRRADGLPAVFVECPSQNTMKALVIAVMEAVGAPPGEDPERRTVKSLTMQLNGTLEGLDTTLFVFDEVQRLDGSDKAGRECGGFLKEMMNTYRNATFVFTGYNVFDGGPFAGTDGEQFRGRCQPLGLTPLPYDSPEEKKEWKRIVAKMESQVRLYGHERGDLVQHAEYLHRRCVGRVGALANLVRLGATKAMRTGTERLTLDTLDTIRLDMSTEEAAKKAARKSKSRTRKQAAKTGEAA